MKIYTRTGDSGSTGLFGGPRVPKDDDRIEAFGTVDELNAAIGTARSAGLETSVDAQLEKIQHELFSMGAQLATPNPDDHNLPKIGSTQIERLEGWIDEHDGSLPELKNFIIPAGDSGASHLHLARAVCRRAERRVVTLQRRGGVGIADDLVTYLNRLSDLLFVLTRVINHHAGVGEVAWTRHE